MLIVLKHNTQKQPGQKRKTFISLTLPDNSPSLRKLRAGTQAEQEAGDRN